MYPSMRGVRLTSLKIGFWEYCTPNHLDLLGTNVAIGLPVNEHRTCFLSVKICHFVGPTV